MLQQITIQTPDAKRLKPLIRSVIENAVYDVEQGVKKTRAKMEACEKQYGMTSAVSSLATWKKRSISLNGKARSERCACWKKSSMPSKKPKSNDRRVL